jgi:hypothetical protein
MATPNPSVLETPVYIAKAKGLFSPGSFVELASGRVALLMKTEGLGNSGLPHSDLPHNLRPKRVKVALLHPFAIRQFSIDRSPCLSPDCRYVPELFISNDEVVVSTQEIERICFVFHPSMPCLKLVCIQGMSAVFICRYNQSGEAIAMDSWRRFPSDYKEYIKYFPTCVPSTVWKAVSATQHVFRKLLGRVSENQGLYPKGRFNVRLSAEAWQYMIGKIEDSIPIRKAHRSTVKRSVRSGLVLTTERDSRSSVVYRFETRQDIQLLVKILGETAIADVRKRKPKLGMQLVLRGNDTINVVACSTVVREAKFARRNEEDGAVSPNPP